MNRQPSFDDPSAPLVASDPIDERALAGRIAPLADDVIAEIVSRADPAPADEPDDAVAHPATVTPLRRRRTWPQIAAAACVAALVAAVAVAGLLPGTSEPAYAITVEDGVVVVNWMRDLRDGEQIGEDLRLYGIDATVRAVPASPSRVGRVLTVAVNGLKAGEMPQGVSWGADGTDEVFTWSIDPSQFTEAIEIEIGVEPDPGDPYTAAESAFAPGEVLGGLHCALGEPVTAAAVDKQLRRLDLDVRWFRVREAAGSDAGDLADEVPASTRPTGTVIDVQPIDAGTVRVTVAPPGAPLTAPIFTPVRPSAECTAELANRWIGVI